MEVILWKSAGQPGTTGIFQTLQVTVNGTNPLKSPFKYSVEPMAEMILIVIKII